MGFASAKITFSLPYWDDTAMIVTPQPVRVGPSRPPLSLDNLCVSVTGATCDAMLTTAARLLPEFSLLELRLDHLRDPASAIPSLAPFVAAHPRASFLATCRPQGSGGQFDGSAHAELAILLAAARAGFALVDLSLESAEVLGSTAIDQLRAAGALVLLSFHDFQQTGSLESVLARMRSLRPDLCKIVPTAQSLTDSLVLLDFLKAHANAPQTVSQRIVALAMGEAGILTRVLGPRAGSAFTFAAAVETEVTAPGQLTARTLVDLYRIRALTSATRLFGVAGQPIRSSLSPLMLNTAFREAGLDAVYLPLLTNDAQELFHVADRLRLEGFSVTMPLKQAVLPFLHDLDPLAARIGAVNTVHRTAGGQWHGWNTDAAGIVTPLEQRLSLRGARVLVLGAGGAARAAVFACADRGAKVYITNRTPEAAHTLAEQADAFALPRERLRSERFDVLINATPAGMRGNALVLPVSEEELRTELVFDLVYNPIETPLIAVARAKGMETIRGIEMFVHQGARQFEIWTGQKAPLGPMQAAVWQRLQDPS